METGFARKGFILAIRVQPRAKRDELRGVLPDGRIKIALTAPPLDGKANQALLKFLSKLLGVNKTKIQICRGVTSRDKLLEVSGIAESEARAKLHQSPKD